MMRWSAGAIFTVTVQHGQGSSFPFDISPSTWCSLFFPPLLALQKSNRTGIPLVSSSSLLGPAPWPEVAPFVATASARSGTGTPTYCASSILRPHFESESILEKL